MKVSKYAIFSKKLILTTGEGELQTIYSTRTNKLKFVNLKIWKRVLDGKWEDISQNLLNELISTEIIVPKNENELKVIIERNKAASKDRKTLYIVIQPTASCNLGCWYCGQNHTKTKINASLYEGLITKIQSILIENETYEKLHIAWFGGEPFLALKEIKYITKKLKKYCSVNNISYYSKIVTNGLTAKKNIVQALISELSLTQIEITIDGLSQYHDKNRYLKNGKPSFNIIYNNIIDICSILNEKIKLSIRCNVSIHNYEGVFPLINKLKNDNISEKITFYLAPVHSWGNDAHKESLSIENFSLLEIGWLTQMYQNNFKLNLIPKRKEEVCLTAMPNSFVLDSYGNSYKCTEISYVDNYIGSSIENIFKISNGIPEKDDLSAIDNFYNDVMKGEYGCNDCKIFPICGGSCPKEWIEGHIPCPPYKFNLEERILLHLSKHLK